MLLESGRVIASMSDSKWELRIEELNVSDRDSVRVGQFVTIPKTGDKKPVRGGFWIDRWEPDHGISKSAYLSLSKHDRAMRELELQFKKWHPSGNYWTNMAREFHAEEHKQWWLKHRPFANKSGWALENDYWRKRLGDNT